MKATFHWLTLAVVAVVPASLVVADRLVDYVPPSLLQDSSGKTNSVAVRARATETQISTMATRRQPDNAARRWERFESEFSIKQHNDSLVLGSLQSAKYQLDKTTFTMQEWMNNIEESLSFDYSLNDLGLPVSAPKPYRSTHSNSFMETVQGARFQSDVNLNVASETYVGVKLVLPLGN